jgi:HEAT repeat protein
VAGYYKVVWRKDGEERESTSPFQDEAQRLGQQMAQEADNGRAHLYVVEFDDGGTRQRATHTFYAKSEAETHAGELGQQADVRGLIKALTSKDPEVRSASAKALGETGDPRAVEPLAKALHDRQGGPEGLFVRMAAAEALVQMGVAAVEPLLSVLRSLDSDARDKAARALAELGKKGLLGETAVKPLIAALKDESLHVYWSAAEALGTIGDPRAVEPLICSLRTRPCPTVAEALERLHDPRAKRALAGYRKSRY